MKEMSPMTSRSVFLMLFAALLPAQTFVDPPILTIDQQLRSRGILPDEASLENALLNVDPEVRILAALKLGDEKNTSAVAAIEAALKKEKMPEVKIQLAFALAELGDSEGLRALTSFCGDQSQSSSIRLGAAQDLLRFGNTLCFQNVLAIVSDPKQDSATVAQAAAVLGEYQRLVKNDSAVLKPLVKLLDSADPTVRIAASQALRHVGATTMMPALQAAIEREKDEGARAQMEADLRILQRQAVKENR